MAAPRGERGVPQGPGRLGASMGTVSPPVTSPGWLQLPSDITGHGSPAAARLEEGLSVFPVYKQARGVCSLPAKGVQPAPEPSCLVSRLRCSRPGELPSPEEAMHGVQGGGLRNVGVSPVKQSPFALLSPKPRAPSCPGSWGAARSVPPPSTTSGHRRDVPTPSPSLAAFRGRTSFPAALKSG